MIFPTIERTQYPANFHPLRVELRASRKLTFLLVMVVTQADIEKVTSSCHRVKVFSVNKSKPFTAKRLKQLEEHGIDLLPITKPLPFDLEGDDEYDLEIARRKGRDPLE